MERTETKKIVDKIKVFRQSFLATNEIYNEWFKVLEPYDYEDVDKKLDEYFKESNNFGQYPDAYYLTKYLKTIEEKQIKDIPHAKCQICGQAVRFEDYKKHYDRCSSVEYLIDVSKRYLGKTLNKEKLMQTDDKTFDDYYYSTCRLVYNKMPDGFPKHLLENVLLTYEGKEPNYNLDEILEEMKG